MGDDSLERLKKRLYKKDETFHGRFEEPELPYYPEKVRSKLPEEEPEEVLSKILKESRFKNMKFFLWIGVLFVLGFAIVASIYIFGGFGAVSSDNIDIIISSPEEVAGGDLVRWEIAIHNKNKVGLASADLAFKYPEGSRPVNRLPSQFLIERVSLGEVSAGDIVRHSFAAHVFGAEKFEGVAEVVLEYRTEGSNAVFEKTEKKNIRIIRSPIGVSIQAPKEINAGREISFTVNYVSNSSEVINDLTLDVLYPGGFTFKNANPQPSEGQSRWFVGDLAPGESRKIIISGTFDGEDLLQESILIQAGVLDGRDLSVYGAGVHSFTLRRRFVDLIPRVNEQEGVSVVKTGDFVSMSILWKNNLLQSVLNSTVEVEIIGEAVDEKSISVSSGSYRGFDKKVVWSPSSLRDLELLSPGEEGQARFAFRVLDAVEISRSQLVNPTIRLIGEIKPGVKPDISEGVDVSGKFDIELKVETDLQLSSNGFYYLSSFPGSGPMPPKVGQETVYTVVWTLANLSNNASGVEVKASLPAYVTWKESFRPATESIIYDPVISEIVWRPGIIEAGTGISRPAREISFQIGFIPSPSQVGHSPVLLFDILTSGRDDFTGNQVHDSELSLTIDITKTDPLSKPIDRTVIAE